MKRAQQGFTLAELLVVVAILGILTAVSIPLYNGLTEASKEKTDKNFETVAATAYWVEYDNYDENSTAVDSFAGTTEFYDLANHEFQQSRAGIKGYGQGTSAGEVVEDHEGMILACTYNDGDLEVVWTTPAMTVSGDNTSNPLLNLNTDKGMTAVYSSRSWKKGDVIDSANANDADAQTAAEYLAEGFPDANITVWRITKETDNNSGITITVTDVDISTLKAGTKVKVIRYNPVKGTYTAAYIPVVTIGTGSSAYNALGITLPLKNSGWVEIADQTDSKTSYAQTVAIYNAASDTQ
jgi:type IV pilus assembly protein PilA